MRHRIRGDNQTTLGYKEFKLIGKFPKIFTERFVVWALYLAHNGIDRCYSAPLYLQIFLMKTILQPIISYQQLFYYLLLLALQLWWNPPSYITEKVG